MQDIINLPSSLRNLYHFSYNTTTTIMSCLLKKLVGLLILVEVRVPASLLQVNNTSSRSNGFLKDQYAHCSNNSECPTWYICNSSNTCQCGDDHDQTIVCDEEALIYIVLDLLFLTATVWHTINTEDQLILGYAFITATLGTLMQYVKNNQQIQKCYQSVKVSTEQTYCVVIVKRDTVHSYSHTTSVVWSVQILLPLCGNL